MFIVPQTFRDVQRFVFEISLEAATRMDVNDVLLTAIVFPKLITLHTMTTEQHNRCLSSFRYIPTRLAVLHSNVALPTEREKLRQLRIFLISRANVKPDSRFLAAIQRVNAIRRIGDGLNRSRRKVRRIHGWIFLHKIRRNFFDKPLKRLALKFLADRFLFC